MVARHLADISETKENCTDRPKEWKSHIFAIMQPIFFVSINKEKREHIDIVGFGFFFQTFVDNETPDGL